MKRIIKPGCKIYEENCETCGCKFTYQDEDKIRKENKSFEGYQVYVECPCCHQMIFLGGAK